MCPSPKNAKILSTKLKSTQFKFRLQKIYFCQMFSCYQTVISKFVIFCWHSWWGPQIFMANLKLYTICHIGVRRIMIEIVEWDTFMSNLTLYTVCHNCSSFELHFHIVIRRIMIENVEREIFYTKSHIIHSLPYGRNCSLSKPHFYRWRYKLILVSGRLCRMWVNSF